MKHLALLFLCVCIAQANHQPNIIFILSDDLSWGDLGCYGQKQIQTPNIDRIAREGMRFSNAYAGNSVCAPSRSCLMQGLHPGHARVRGNSYQSYREGLHKDDVTVAEVLKKAGYRTGLFGKWGLGLSGQPEAIPNRQGFDQFFGYLNQRKAHSFYPPFLWNQTKRVPTRLTTDTIIGHRATTTRMARSCRKESRIQRKRATLLTKSMPNP